MSGLDQERVQAYTEELCHYSLMELQAAIEGQSPALDITEPELREAVLRALEMKD
ncbi:hypothetical protein ACFL3C_01550 [Patescibacteria group bacterium]